MWITVSNPVKNGPEDSARFTLLLRKASLPFATSNNLLSVEYENIYPGRVDSINDGIRLHLTNQNGSSDAGPDFSAYLTKSHTDLQFRSYNTDASISTQHIEWGRLVEGQGGGWYTTAEPVTSTILLNNQKLKIRSVDVWSQCFGDKLAGQ
jgi:hypothetical protein